MEYDMKNVIVLGSFLFVLIVYSYIYSYGTRKEIGALLTRHIFKEAVHKAAIEIIGRLVKQACSRDSMGIEKFGLPTTDADKFNTMINRIIEDNVRIAVEKAVEEFKEQIDRRILAEDNVERVIARINHLQLVRK